MLRARDRGRQGRDRAGARRRCLRRDGGAGPPGISDYAAGGGGQSARPTVAAMAGVFAGEAAAKMRTRSRRIGRVRYRRRPSRRDARRRELRQYRAARRRVVRRHRPTCDRVRAPTIRAGGRQAVMMTATPCAVAERSSCRPPSTSTARRLVPTLLDNGREGSSACPPGGSTAAGGMGNCDDHHDGGALALLDGGGGQPDNAAGNSHQALIKAAEEQRSPGCADRSRQVWSAFGPSGHRLHVRR